MSAHSMTDSKELHQSNKRKIEVVSASLAEAIATLPQLLSKRNRELDKREAKRKRELDKREEALDKREEALDEREEALQKTENASAKEFSKAHGSTKESDILSLNVGGTLHQTQRRTLCISEGSMLAAKFSGRWDDSLDKDTDGNFLIDQSNAIFEPLLSFFRACASVTPYCPPVTMMDFEPLLCKNKNFMRMVEYYGCTPTVYPTDVVLHRGLEEHVKIQQYPDTIIEASQWATFVLQARGHHRKVKSCQIEVSNMERMLIGVYDVINFPMSKSENKKGVDEDGSSFALDCGNCTILHGGKTLAEKINIGKQIGNGSIIQLDILPNECNISVDSKLVVNMKILSRRYLIPALSGKGTFKVKNIVLHF